LVCSCSSGASEGKVSFEAAVGADGCTPSIHLIGAATRHAYVCANFDGLRFPLPVAILIFLNVPNLYLRRLRIPSRAEKGDANLFEFASELQGFLLTEFCNMF